MGAPERRGSAPQERRLKLHLCPPKEQTLLTSPTFWKMLNANLKSVNLHQFVRHICSFLPKEMGISKRGKIKPHVEYLEYLASLEKCCW